MPDTTTWYLSLQRDALGRVTNSVEKWTASSTDYYRTNRYKLSTDGYDLIQHIGPNGELVGGYGYNAGHHVTSFTNAVGEVTSYTYSTDGRYRPILTTFPSGLISSNIYGGDGFLSKTVDYLSGSPLRTNSFTWQNAMVHTNTDSRGMTRTFTYDALNRLTRIDYPDSTYIQYGYTNGAGTKLLDLTYKSGVNP